MPNTRMIHFENPLLRQLQPSVRKYSINLLHLGTRAANALAYRGISSIGQLVDAAHHGFAAPRAGIGTIAEIEEVLDSVSSSIDSNGRVDWLRYAAKRHFLILPQEALSEFSIPEFIRIFPAVMEEAVESACGPPGKLIFQRSLLGDDSGVVMARRLGFSKQAASLTKEKVLRILGGAIFNDDYRGCSFRLRPTFVAPLRDLKEALDKTRGRAFPYSEWGRIVVTTWGVAATEVAGIENLLFILFGYQVVRPTNQQAETIVLPTGRNVLSFRNALANTARLLTREFPSGLSKLELLRELRRSKRNAALSLSEISALVEGTSGVETVGPKRKIRVNMDHLLRMTDQLERILRGKGVATHVLELAAEVRRYKGRAGSIRSARNVGAAMTGDKRFRVIGTESCLDSE